MKSFLAVFAGLLFIFGVTTLVDIILHTTHVFPPMGQPMSDGLLVLATAYRLVIDTYGCYLAARLAPQKPMKHALILGVIGVVLSSAGAYAMWNLGHHWYPILLIVSSMPSAWLGGRIYQKRRGLTF